jgi:hypothetical protein
MSSTGIKKRQTIGITSLPGFFSWQIFEGQATRSDEFIALGLHYPHSQEGDGFLRTVGKILSAKEQEKVHD